MNVQKGILTINEKELLTLVSEKGQIFELDLLLKNSHEYRFIVRDGSSIDIVGNGEKLPVTVVDDHKDLDINLFRLDQNLENRWGF